MSETLTLSNEDRSILESAPVRALLEPLRDSVRLSDAGRVELVNAEALRAGGIDHLVKEAVFGATPDVRDTARWIIAEVGAELGVVPASIHDLYVARGRGEVSGFTVPAMNIRAMSYDTGLALFRAAERLNAGALILEIARSEIGYTDQRPTEYVAVMTAAAIRAGWSGPLFFQGDHVQINAKKYAADPQPEVHALCDLIREQIAAGFYNIDVDTSTLVDIHKATLEEQQELNCRLSADFTEFIRRHEPKGVTVSIGGEIGEVGTENSTPEELRAYMDGYNRELARLSEKSGKPLVGQSKISVQSGTSHGGTVLPDGSIADVAIDFETLEVLSKLARDEYGMAGAVQHGASTLPESKFGTFPKIEVAEIHLATGFQNLVYDHPALPDSLRQEMYEHCRQSFPEERKPSDTEEQFIYKARKKALGAFKRQLWELPEDVRAEIRATLQEKFDFLFRQLAVVDTADVVKRHVTPVRRPLAGPTSLRLKAAADDWDLSD